MSPGRPHARLGNLFDPSLISVFTLSACAWAYLRPSFTQDEVLLLVYPDLVNHGRWPNRDFFTPYGPGTFWPLSAAYRLTGGPSVLAERTMGATYHVVVALAVWAVARRYGRSSALIAGSAAGAIAGGLQLVAYGWMLALACLVWSVVAGRSHHLVWSGILAALACTVRPDTVVVVALIALVQRRGKREWTRFVVGLAVGFIPLTIHVSLAPTALARNTFLDRVGTDTRLPILSQSGDLLLGLLLVFLCALALTGHAVWRRDRHDAAIAALAVGILPQALQRLDHEHLLFVATAVAPLALVAAIDLARHRLQLMPPRWTAVALVSTLAVVTLAGLALAFAAPRGSPVRVGDRVLYAASPAAARELERSSREIDTAVPAGEPILVGTADSRWFAPTPLFLYFLLPGRIPNAYYLELAPGVSERRNSRLIDDFRRAKTLLLSPSVPEITHQLYPLLPVGSSQVNRYVSANFVPMSSTGGHPLYRRKPSPQTLRQPVRWVAGEIRTGPYLAVAGGTRITVKLSL